MSSILNESKITQAQIEFSAMFRDALAIANKSDPVIDMLATEVRSDKKTVIHNWLNDVPAFKPWKAERPIGKLSADGVQITTVKVGNGIEVDEDDLEDDNLGIYKPQIMSVAEKATTYKRDRLAQFLALGFGTTLGTSYDGVAFFSASHPSPNAAVGNQSNIMTATLDDTDAFNDAYAKMGALKDPGGNPAGFRPTHLIYGPSNRKNALAILESEFGANGSSNFNANSGVQPVQLDLLTGAYAAYWFLADLSKALKPLIWQIRRDVRFRRVGSEGGGEDNSYEQFLTGKLFYGADMRAEAGYGMWQAIVGSNGST